MDHRRLRNAALALAGIAAGLAAPRAHASLVLAMDLTELTRHAERIVVGEVMSVKSGWDAKREKILSTIEVKVAEAWKGQMPAGGRMTIVQPGGVADGIEMKVHGLPAFVAGERAVLFLRGGDAPRSLSLVGLGQGKRGLTFDGASKRWMVDGGDRSAAVRIDATGRTQPAPPEPILPLEELRRRIGTMVKAR